MGKAMSFLLSPHFSYAEAVATKTGLPNAPTLPLMACASRLCNGTLEALRSTPLSALGGRRVGSLIVNSMIRTERVNAKVGGSKNSAHKDGRAADVRPVDREVRLSMIMEELPASGVPFDKAILEWRGGRPWLHIQVRTLPRENRGDRLLSLAPGEFVRWNPDDPRLVGIEGT